MPSSRLAIYRIVQESLTNTLKHGGPGAAATVGFDWQRAALAVTVADNGHGVGPGRTDGGGHGLVGMRERIALYGGSLRAGPRGSEGYSLAADIPVDPAPEVILTSSLDGSDFGALVADSPALGFIPKGDLSARAVEALLGRAG